MQFEVLGIPYSWILLTVLVCGIVAGILTAIANWIAWIFALGRYDAQRTVARSIAELANSGGRPSPAQDSLARIFLSEIVFEFKNFLALVVVSTFAILLIYVAVFKAVSAKDLEDMLKSVSATLSGLVGSVIGFYFGSNNSGARKEKSTDTRSPEQRNDEILPVGEPKGLPRSPDSTIDSE